MERYKFEKLRVWQLALEYIDAIYDLTKFLPEDERWGLSTQIKRAANSVALNIAEGSTGLTNKEQIRFLRISMRSLVETVAALRIIRKRALVSQAEIDRLEPKHKELFNRLQAFIKSLDNINEFHEPDPDYGTGEDN